MAHTAETETETREFWQLAIATWRAGGLSVREFCQREGLAQATFYAWRKRLTGANASLSPPKHGRPKALTPQPATNAPTAAGPHTEGATPNASAAPSNATAATLSRAYSKPTGPNVRAAEPKTPDASSFVEVSLPPPTDDAPLELVLASGHVLRIGSLANSTILHRVLSALRQVELC